MRDRRGRATAALPASATTGRCGSGIRPPAQQQTVLTGHQGQILGVCAVTVDGRQLVASAGTDWTVRIWDPTRAEQADLEGHQGWVRAMCTVTVAEHPVVVSAGGDGTVRIWNPATGSQLLAFESHERSAYRVCPVTVDGRQLLASASDDATVVRIWDPATGAEQAVLEGHQFVVHGICAVTVDGRELLASADMRTVRIWDPATGAEQAVLKGLGDVMFGQICAVTVDGHQLLGRYGQLRDDADLGPSHQRPACSPRRPPGHGHRSMHRDGGRARAAGQRQRRRDGADLGPSHRRPAGSP